MTSHVLSLDNTPARLDRNDARDRPWVVVALSGDLDIAATRPLAELDAVVADNPGSRVLVDLTNVTFIDSAALRVFTRTMETAAAGGGLLSLHGASDRASRLLQLWHLEPEPGATRHASSQRLGARHSICRTSGHATGERR